MGGVLLAAPGRRCLDGVGDEGLKHGVVLSNSNRASVVYHKNLLLRSPKEQYWKVHRFLCCVFFFFLGGGLLDVFVALGLLSFVSPWPLLKL